MVVTRRLVTACIVATVRQTVGFFPGMSTAWQRVGTGGGYGVATTAMFDDCRVVLHCKCFLHLLSDGG